jgi:putative component of toxin-antitoxin plasmid stabilization module
MYHIKRASKAPMGQGIDKSAFVSYRIRVIEILKTEEFDAWLSTVSDHKAVAKIVSRIERLALGNPGDVKPVGEGISEMRIPRARATAFISSKPARKSFCCCVAETSQRRTTISGKQSASPRNYEGIPDGKDLEIRRGRLPQDASGDRRLSH